MGRDHQKKYNAFTLIELLVVIAIIALLLSIVLPSLKKVKGHARALICNSNLKQWGVVFNLYASDNDGRFMVWKASGEPGGGTWILPILEYSQGSDEMRLCPEATKTPEEGEGVPARMAWSTTIDGQYHKNSYAINNWIYDLRPGVNNVWGLPNADKQSWRHNLHRQPYTVPMFLEGWRWGGGPENRSQPAPPDDQTRHNTAFGRYCLDRHFGAIIVCFMDGSCRKVGLKQLWDLKWHREYNLSDPLPTWPEWMQSLKD